MNSQRYNLTVLFAPIRIVILLCWWLERLILSHKEDIPIFIGNYRDMGLASLL